MKRTGPMNTESRLLISKLKSLASKEKSAVWKRAADELNKANRRKRVVNLSKINRNAGSEDYILVLGKVLGVGNIEKKVKIAAFSFSDSAKNKLEAAKCQVLSVQDLMKANPKGKKVKVLG
jgi:large subunit ribosomal protein L18e